MLQMLLAFSAGVLTIAAPCVLPMAPIVLGASVAQSSRSRPLFIALGFAAAFSSAALLLGAFSDVLPLSPSRVRDFAALALLAFGVLMLWTRPMHVIGERMGGFLTRAQDLSRRAGSGNWGGFVLGSTLGVLWTPCAGPVLASILTLVATTRNLGWSALLLACYALGAAIPMLGIAYGGRYATTRIRRIAPHARSIQQAFGVLTIAIAVAMALELDALATAWFSNFLPEPLLTL
ncbi:MAG TPA: cytochrome c biogenesis CcdA family protein [Burkholderiales bacterium]|nr:cytochrome c biogenesis CcdA family protein [Burkholderiales bacterium]